LRSRAAVGHLLQGSTCRVFRDAPLQISVVTSGYLSYYCLSISSNYGHDSPLTKALTMHFLHIELTLPEYNGL